MLQVKLSHAPNPDIGGYWDSRYLDAPKQQWVEIKTLQDASALCRAYIDKYGLGGGNWTGGQIKMNGKAFAHVSYNGRVWEGSPKSWTPQTRALI